MHGTTNIKKKSK